MRTMQLEHTSAQKRQKATSTVFADDLIKIIKELSDHTKRMISQFCRIKEIKEIIAENNNSLCIRVDWFVPSKTRKRKLLSQYPSLS